MGERDVVVLAFRLEKGKRTSHEIVEEGEGVSGEDQSSCQAE